MKVVSKDTAALCKRHQLLMKILAYTLAGRSHHYESKAVINQRVEVG